MRTPRPSMSDASAAIVSRYRFQSSTDGNSHAATGSATGVRGEDLSALLGFGATVRTDATAGAVTDRVGFAGDGNYNSATRSVTDQIDKATENASQKIEQRADQAIAALERHREVALDSVDRRAAGRDDARSETSR